MARGAGTGSGVAVEASAASPPAAIATEVEVVVAVELEVDVEPSVVLPGQHAAVGSAARNPVTTNARILCPGCTSKQVVRSDPSHRAHHKHDVREQKDARHDDDRVKHLVVAE